jgi:hypothetical protein
VPSLSLRDEKSLRLLLAKLDVSGGESACWPYMGSRRNGYGRIGRFIDGRTVYLEAHREMYRLVCGPTDDFDVLHTCDNPPCCNPRHLFRGTHGDNMRDREQKDRHNAPHGSGHAESKLTEDKVRIIRADHARGSTYAALARQFGVSDVTIGRIVKREAWQHVECG